VEEEAMEQSCEVEIACGHNFEKKALQKEMNLGETERN